MPTIERIGGSAVPLPARRIRSAGGFTVGTVAAEQAGGSGPTAALTAAGLFTVLEDAIEPPQDRAARRHGRALLTALSSLQALVLAGDPSAGLGPLAELLCDVPAPVTPALASALDAVLLRARIELARYGR